MTSTAASERVTAKTVNAELGSTMAHPPEPGERLSQISDSGMAILSMRRLVSVYLQRQPLPSCPRFALSGLDPNRGQPWSMHVKVSGVRSKAPIGSVRSNVLISVALSKAVPRLRPQSHSQGFRSHAETAQRQSLGRLHRRIQSNAPCPAEYRF